MLTSGGGHGKSYAHPLLVLGTAFVTLWLAYVTGSWLRRNSAGDEHNEDIGLILAATLTLLALIIGFSFSMATNRYDQRKNFEEGEANAIGTEILLPTFYLRRMPQKCGCFLASTRPAHRILY
jgi:hypothetical protein